MVGSETGHSQRKSCIIPSTLASPYINCFEVLQMPSYDKRIDAYIEKSAEFAQPVMIHLRELIHKGCPEVSETLKWSMPSFEYKGQLWANHFFERSAVG